MDGEDGRFRPPASYGEHLFFGARSPADFWPVIGYGNIAPSPHPTKEKGFVSVVVYRRGNLRGELRFLEVTHRETGLVSLPA